MVLLYERGRILLERKPLRIDLQRDSALASLDLSRSSKNNEENFRNTGWRHVQLLSARTKLEKRSNQVCIIREWRSNVILHSS